MTFSFTMLMTLASATAIKPVPPLSELLGAALDRGTARLNGVTMPIEAWRDAADLPEIAAKLRAACKGVCSVSELPGGPRGLFLVSPAWSEDCPSCPRPTAANLDAIVAGTLAVSLVALPAGGRVAFASPVGKLLVQRPARLSYEGGAFERLPDDVTVEQQATYVFGSTVVHSVVGLASESPARLHGRLADELAAAGLKPLAPAASPGETALGGGSKSHESTWQSERTVVRIATAIDPATSRTMVVIHEVLDR